MVIQLLSTERPFCGYQFPQPMTPTLSFGASQSFLKPEITQAWKAPGAYLAAWRQALCEWTDDGPLGLPGCVQWSKRSEGRRREERPGDRNKLPTTEVVSEARKFLLTPFLSSKADHSLSLAAQCLERRSEANANAHSHPLTKHTLAVVESLACIAQTSSFVFPTSSDCLSLVNAFP